MAEQLACGFPELAGVFLPIEKICHGAALVRQELRADPRALGCGYPVAVPVGAALFPFGVLSRHSFPEDTANIGLMLKYS